MGLCVLKTANTAKDGPKSCTRCMTTVTLAKSCGAIEPEEGERPYCTGYFRLAPNRKKKGLIKGSSRSQVQVSVLETGESAELKLFNFPTLRHFFKKILLNSLTASVSANNFTDFIKHINCFDQLKT